MISICAGSRRWRGFLTKSGSSDASGTAVTTVRAGQASLPLHPPPAFMSDLERYISDNALRVSTHGQLIAPQLTSISQFFGLSDRSIVDYVVASGKSITKPEHTVCQLTTAL